MCLHDVLGDVIGLRVLLPVREYRQERVQRLVGDLRHLVVGRAPQRRRRGAVVVPVRLVLKTRQLAAASIAAARTHRDHDPKQRQARQGCLKEERLGYALESIFLNGLPLRRLEKKGDS